MPAPRFRLVALYALLLLFNVGAWLWAVAALRGMPVLLGTALVAYTFGLRHAVDADHIAAIDNVTRKLMQSGARPVTTGLWFSLGHATVVVIGALAIAAAALHMQAAAGAWRAVGELVGTLISAGFLIAIGGVNLALFASARRAFRRAREGGGAEDTQLSGVGLMARLYRPVFGLIGRSWHMYPLGFLFGLGFDTATEVGVLGLSVAEAARGLSLWAIAALPVLFAAGMALVDTTDSVIMVGAYGWALERPLRRLYYNLVITLISAAFAIAVGGLEMLGLAAGKMGWGGTAGQALVALNQHAGAIGVGIISLFALCWGAAVVVYRWRRLGEPANDSQAAAL
ncbi:MAG: HoxN/HupN/NixA family nickel/cobalt transporter [Terriglobales bacterium]